MPREMQGLTFSIKQLADALVEIGWATERAELYIEDLLRIEKKNKLEYCIFEEDDHVGT